MLGIPPEGRAKASPAFLSRSLCVSWNCQAWAQWYVSELPYCTQSRCCHLFISSKWPSQWSCFFLRKGFIFFGRHNLVATCTHLMQQWHSCFAPLVHVISDFFQPYVDFLANKLMRGLDIISCSSVSVMTILICCSTSDNTTAIPHVCYHLRFSPLFLQAW